MGVRCASLRGGFSSSLYGVVDGLRFSEAFWCEFTLGPFTKVGRFDDPEALPRGTVIWYSQG